MQHAHSQQHDTQCMKGPSPCSRSVFGREAQHTTQEHTSQCNLQPHFQGSLNGMIYCLLLSCDAEELGATRIWAVSNAADFSPAVPLVERSTNRMGSEKMAIRQLLRAIESTMQSTVLIQERTEIFLQTPNPNVFLTVSFKSVTGQLICPVSLCLLHPPD